jgi:hypothetical protein
VSKSKFDGIFFVKEKGAKKPGAHAASPRASRRATGKRSDPNYTQITAYIRKDTHEGVMRAIYKRQELSELIEDLLAGWLKKQK